VSATRAEHIAWVKERALAELDAGSVVNAMSSVTSDLRKHPDTDGHAAIELMAMLAIGGHLGNETQMREFIGGIQ
jgi:hypothetical protein